MINCNAFTFIFLSNIDALRSIICAIRQMIAMEASIKFVSNNLQNVDPLSKEELKSFESNINSLKGKISNITRTAKALHEKAKFVSTYLFFHKVIFNWHNFDLQWNELNKPADLITSVSKKSIVSFKMKLVTFCAIIIFSYGSFKMLKA